MTAVSPYNPNLCLSCEQLIEGDSAELEQLLAAAEDSGNAGQPARGVFADEFSPSAGEGAPSAAATYLKQPIFVAPA